MTKGRKNEGAAQQEQEVGCHTTKLAKWQVKLAARLGMFDAPGAYPFVLIVDESGRRKLRLPKQDVEELGP